MTPDDWRRVLAQRAADGIGDEDSLLMATLDEVRRLLAALDAAEKDNEALRARLAELERVVEFHVARGLSVDAMRFVQKALATPTDGTPAATRTGWNDPDRAADDLAPARTEEPT